MHNTRKLLDELRTRGYEGGYSQLKLAVTPWREEGRERAFVRLETGPGEQSQMDRGHFGNWGGRRLYGFALTLCYSRMRYIEFTQTVVNGTDEKKSATQPPATQAASSEATGTVIVDTNPNGADIYVDDQFCGNGPATLKLKSGKHPIASRCLASKTGLENWHLVSATRLS